MYSRRQLIVTALAAATTSRAWAATATADMPDILRRLMYPGSQLNQVSDPGIRGGATYNAAGKLPGGATQLRAWPGSKRYELHLDAPDAGPQLIVKIFKHIDAAVKQAGGKLLNKLDAPPTAWTDIATRIFLYELPDPAGEIQFGLWIQSGGREIFFYQMAQAPEKPQASELQMRLDSLGRVALYFNFDTNRAELRPDAEPVLGELLKLLNEAPTLRLSIEGHTDNVGQAADNAKLSLARAQSVMQALQGRGIAAQRLKAAGFGATRPVADNALEAGRARNRRVEIVKW